MTRSRIVLQGFGPDREIAKNPSQVIVEAIAADPPDGVDVIDVVWPNSADAVRLGVERLLTRHEPHLWLGLGAATSRRSLSIERHARNRLDFPYADADGRVIRDQPVEAGGDEQLDSDVDVDAIVDNWRADGIPAYVSTDAGGFLCNMSLYLALAQARSRRTSTRCAFIHVLYLPDQVGDPEQEASMSLDLQVRAIRVAIRAAI